MCNSQEASVTGSEYMPESKGLDWKGRRRLICEGCECQTEHSRFVSGGNRKPLGFLELGERKGESSVT